MNRNIIFDIARAISVIIVIAIWHLFDYLSVRPQGILDSLFATICASALALFTFMSGYFLSKYKIQEMSDVLTFYKKRFKRFYILYFISLTTLFIGGFVSSISMYLKSIVGISPYLPPQPYTLWYMSMLISFYFITPFILYCKNFNYKITVSIICFCLIYFFDKLITPIDQRVLVYFPFYCFGILASNNKIYKSKYLFIYLFIYIISFIAKLKMLEAYNVLQNMIQYILSLSGILIILSISSFISKNKALSNIMGKIAYSSLIAYLFHRHIYFILTRIFPQNIFFQIMYLILIIVPLIFISSFYIQKYYDLILSKYEKMIKNGK